MTLTLANYRTRVLALLDDAALARYSTDEVDQGLRNALMDFTNYRPIIRTYSLDTAGTYQLELPADFSAAYITMIELYNADPNLVTEITFSAWQKDEAWFINTPDVCYPTGYVLTIHYAAPHTIDSLDSASGTTIDDDNLLCIGAAGYCAQTRAVSRAESINMQPEVQAKLLQLAGTYLSQFMGRIRPTYSVAVATLSFPSP